MKYIKRGILLLLFCLSLNGCNSKENEIKHFVEDNVVESGTYDNIVVEKINNYENTIYMVYIYAHFMNDSGGVSYHVDIYVYNGLLEWVYSA